jgi:enoyl-CoA hydratase
MQPGVQRSQRKGHLRMTQAEGAVRLHIDGPIAAVVFDRPAARNAMTWAMYAQLSAICAQLSGTPALRVVTFRGSGGEAFVAGTDIAQFQAFAGGDDGVAYERQIDDCIGRIEALPMPTLALIEGFAVGGGLAIATACDFRIATRGARLGVPIAKTLGNCLSMANLARLVAAFGVQRVRRMLLLAELIGADEALDSGYLHSVCAADELESAAAALCERLAALAPVTQSVVKEGLRRLTVEHVPDGEDLIRRCYASSDFDEGVTAFVGRRPPVWTGS